MTIEQTIISDCEQYRYQLHRPLRKLGITATPAVFIMLNPSTADAEKDDPTIRRCIRFAERFGNSSLVVFNLYAYRATKPEDLWLADDPYGPANDKYLSRIHLYTKQVICAWGGNARWDRVKHVVDLLQSKGVKMMCLGQTTAGAPRHPLYIKGDTDLTPWVIPAQFRTEDDEI